MKKIVTIGGGNGQSNLLDAFCRYAPGKYKISSIVSMSDDGRTTGKLMKKFKNELDLHLPPPGDLRRCLFMMSASKKRDEFQQYLETVIERDFIIEELNIWDYFRLVGADENFKNHLLNVIPVKEESLESGDLTINMEGYDILNFTLPLTSSIKGHKLGNILMANLYYNLERDYHRMLEFMHRLLEVDAKIIPVTTGKAYIKAILGNGEEIETQDRISNVAAYSSGIADLTLMEDSKDAGGHQDVFHAIQGADYILIAPGDLFTSIISNFVVGGVKEAIAMSQAQIIYIGNTTNKGGETQGLTHVDFVNKIERFLGRRLDMFICNNKHLELSEYQRERFQNSISVKGGDFLYLSDGEKSELGRRGIGVFEYDLLDRGSFYKHDTQKLMELLDRVLSL